MNNVGVLECWGRVSAGPPKNRPTQEALGPKHVTRKSSKKCLSFSRAWKSACPFPGASVEKCLSFSCLSEKAWKSACPFPACPEKCPEKCLSFSCLLSGKVPVLFLLVPWKSACPFPGTSFPGKSACPFPFFLWKSACPFPVSFPVSFPGPFPAFFPAFSCVPVPACFPASSERRPGWPGRTSGDGAPTTPIEQCRSLGRKPATHQPRQA